MASLYILSLGDILCVFSQFGEIVDLNLCRDKETGKPMGFAFIAYEDQRSTVLGMFCNGVFSLVSILLKFAFFFFRVFIFFSTFWIFLHYSCG